MRIFYILSILCIFSFKNIYAGPADIRQRNGEHSDISRMFDQLSAHAGEYRYKNLFNVYLSFFDAPIIYSAHETSLLIDAFIHHAHLFLAQHHNQRSYVLLLISHIAEEFLNQKKRFKGRKEKREILRKIWVRASFAYGKNKEVFEQYERFLSQRSSLNVAEGIEFKDFLNEMIRFYGFPLTKAILKSFYPHTYDHAYVFFKTWYLRQLVQKVTSVFYLEMERFLREYQRMYSKLGLLFEAED